MYRFPADRHLIPSGLDDDADAYVAAFERLNNLTPTKAQRQAANVAGRLGVAS